MFSVTNAVDMNHLYEQAYQILRILPWIESIEDIILFLKRVPRKYEYSRTWLALKYFLKSRDNSTKSQTGILTDAAEISKIFPQLSFEEIQKRLKKLGTVYNRKEIVVRMILNESCLRKQLKDMLSNTPELMAVEPHTQLEAELNGYIHEQSTSSTVKNDRKRPIETVLDNTNEQTSSFKIIKVETVQKQANQIEEVQPTTSHSLDIKDRKVKEDQIRFPFLLNGRNYKEVPAVKLKSKPVKRVTFSDCIQVSDAPRLEPPAHSNSVAFEETRDLSPQPYARLNSPTYEDVYGLPRRRVLFDDLAAIISSEDVDDLPRKRVSFDDLSSISCEDVDDLPQFDDVPHDNLDPTTDKDVHNLPQQFEPDARLNSATYEDVHDLPQQFEPQIRLNPPTNKESYFAPRLCESPTSDFLNFLTAPQKLEPDVRVNIQNTKEVPAVPPYWTDVISLISETENPRDDILETDAMEINLSESITRTQGNSEVQPKNDRCDEALILRLKEIFPQACPDYIQLLCQGKRWSEFDHLVTALLSEDYPRRPERVPSPPKEIDLEEQLKIVKELLPDADPTFLAYKCEKIGNDVQALNEFINEAREKKDYPTKKEYLRNQKFTAQIKQYTTEFNVEHFVTLFPNPEKTFKDPKRTLNMDFSSEAYVSFYFQRRYDRLSIKVIRAALLDTNFNVIAADEILQSKVKMGVTLKSRRKSIRNQNPPQNIRLLQDLAYLTHKEEIQQYIKEAKEKVETERKYARENNLMNECKCCYDTEVMPKESFSCPNGCIFCKSCIQKSSEICFGEGKTEITCLNGCNIEFSIHTLQSVLPPKLFSKLAQKKALAEVTAAGIDELESCPFCDFANIPSAEDKIFRCLNPECMKESCRSCKEENHVPYKCDEVEKDDDVKARVFVENQMTEALLCKCYKCGTSFFKEEGCNKMTCVCGATMCYVCKQPVKDYTHFNGLGGDKFERCPLYSDSNELNRGNVLAAAEAAKSKVDPNKLKIDPTLDIKQHYEERKKVLPNEPHMGYVRVNQQIQREILEMPAPGIRHLHLNFFHDRRHRRFAPMNRRAHEHL